MPSLPGAGAGRAVIYYLIPNIFPNLRCLPALVIGIPEAFAILRFTFVMPSARFQLKDSPGILKDFFAIIYSPPFQFLLSFYRIDYVHTPSSLLAYWQSIRL